MITWLAAEPAAGGGTDVVQWVMAAAAVLGAIGGLAAFVTVRAQKKKFAADAADVLTDTALTLVEPLKARVRELQDEVTTWQTKVKAAQVNVDELSDSVVSLTTMMRRWRAAILHPRATIEGLREMVTADPGPSRNGTAEHD